jgi:hypothetical protein
MQAKDRKSEMEDIVVGGVRAERIGLRQITAWLQTSPVHRSVSRVFEIGGVEAFVNLLTSNSIVTLAPARSL